jgi:peptide/nickel transport system permease protein
MAARQETIRKALTSQPGALARRRIPRWVVQLLRNPISMLGILIVLFYVVVALLAPVLAPPEEPSLPYHMPRAGFFAEPQPPSSEHPFGTSQNQYDIYYGVIWGTRTAFKVGLIITGLTVLIGSAIGAAAAYAGGWVDEVVQRIGEIVLAFPFFLAALTLAIVLASTLQNGLVSAGIALIVFSWPGYARLIRGEILAIKQSEYVLAARVMGIPGWRILLRHILPNATTSLLVVASLDIGTNVLSFASLSFLGLGPEIGYADWGQLLSFARNWISDLAKFWYIVVFPGSALILFVLGWNLIGDAFRDALDPRSRNR